LQLLKNGTAQHLGNGPEREMFLTLCEVEAMAHDKNDVLH
jgi:hypothetical protein